MRPIPSHFLTKRRLRRWLILAGIAFCGWLIASFAVAYELTRRPRAPFAEPVPNVGWGRLEAHRIATSDGQWLGAWYAQGRDEGPSVLLLHGNGGSRRNCLSRASILAEEGGCSVLLVSLRAHGDSTGNVNDIGFSARHDVIAAVNFLHHRRPGKPVIVQGVSLGAAAAIFASGDLGEMVQGYILESPYRDLKTAVRHRTQAYLPPVLDQVAYCGLRLSAPVILPDFESIAPIRAIDRMPSGIPVLLLSGTDDPLAQPSEVRALYHRVRSHGRLELIPGGGHHDLMRVAPGHYRRLVLDFCTRAAGTSVD